MLIMQGCLLSGGDKIKYLHSTQRLRVDIIKYLVTFLFYLWRQTPPTFFYTDIPDSFLHYPTLGEMSQVLYHLLISLLLARDHMRFQALELQNPASWSRVLCTRVSVQSHLELYCAPGIGLTRLLVAWKPFPKLLCFKCADNKLPNIRLHRV